MPSEEFTRQLAGDLLDALISNGGRLVAACAQVGISYGQVFRWRRDEPEFATAMDDALVISTSVLEDKALELALDGDRVIEWQKGEDGKPQKVERVKRYPQLLMFMLEARRPNTYRRTIKVDGTFRPDERPVLEGVASAAGQAFALLGTATRVERAVDVEFSESPAASPVEGS